MYVIESKVCGLKLEETLQPLICHNPDPVMVLSGPLLNSELTRSKIFGWDIWTVPITGIFICLVPLCQSFTLHVINTDHSTKKYDLNQNEKENSSLHFQHHGQPDPVCHYPTDQELVRLSSHYDSSVCY